MKKTIISIGLLGLLSIGLFGCGESQQSKEAAQIQQYQTQIDKQHQEQANKKQVLDEMFKNAKVEGNSYTFTNNSNYTFQFIQLFWTEYNKDGSLTYKAESVSKQANNIKPGQSFTLETHLSGGVSMKVTHLEGSVQN